jgi:phosphoserine phosphatase
VRLALLDMDGTVLMGRSLRSLVSAFGLEEELERIRLAKLQGLPEREIARRVAAMFAGRPIAEVYRVFDGIPLTPGVAWWLKEFKAAGGKVALVSDSWLPLVERLGRRLGVDAVWANGLEIEEGVITGRLFPPPCPDDIPRECREFAACKLNALRSLAGRFSVPPEEVVAVGDGLADVCMLRASGLGVALNPKDAEVAEAADVVIYGDFYDLAAALRGEEVTSEEDLGS